MPKTAYDFTREMIFYIIKCNDDSITDMYVGSTFDFARRKGSHKSVCNNNNSINHNLKIYQVIRENGGWNNWSMNVVDRKIVKDKIEATQYEQSLIDKYKTNLNTIRAFVSEEHITNRHYNFKCEKCNNVFETARNLRRHTDKKTACDLYINKIDDTVIQTDIIENAVSHTDIKLLTDKMDNGFKLLNDKIDMLMSFLMKK